jgi:hypothetical protein
MYIILAFSLILRITNIYFFFIFFDFRVKTFFYWLNSEITEKEIEDSIRLLKNNRAAEYDQIVNEY